MGDIVSLQNYIQRKYISKFLNFLKLKEKSREFIVLKYKISKGKKISEKEEKQLYRFILSKEIPITEQTIKSLKFLSSYLSKVNTQKIKDPNNIKSIENLIKLKNLMGNSLYGLDTLLKEEARFLNLKNHMEFKKYFEKEIELDKSFKIYFEEADKKFIKSLGYKNLKFLKYFNESRKKPFSFISKAVMVLGLTFAIFSAINIGSLLSIPDFTKPRQGAEISHYVSVFKDEAQHDHFWESEGQENLPEQRQVFFQENEKVLPNLIYREIMLMPTRVLDKMTDGFGRSLKCFAHYLNANGQEMQVDINEDEWQFLIEQGVRGGWSEPDSEGWEYLRVEGGIVESGTGGRSFRDLWNIFGNTTIKRKITGNDAQIEVHGETFDFIGSPNTSENVQNRYGHDSNVYIRLVPRLFGQVAQRLFRGVVYIIEDPDNVHGANTVRIAVDKKFVERYAGKPFRVQASTQVPISFFNNYFVEEIQNNNFENYFDRYVIIRQELDNNTGQVNSYFVRENNNILSFRTNQGAAKYLEDHNLEFQGENYRYFTEVINRRSVKTFRRLIQND